MTDKKIYKSEAMESIYASFQALKSVGAVGESYDKEFNEMCLENKDSTDNKSNSLENPKNNNDNPKD